MDYLAENRSMNWSLVPDHAPDFVKNYVREFRGSRAEKRSFSPVVLQATLGGIEQRSVAAAALRTAARLFPTKSKQPACAPTSDMAVLRSIARRQAAELHADLKVLSRARLDAEAKREAETLALEIADLNAEIFPWERRS
jgi:hypothetical protein